MVTHFYATSVRVNYLIQISNDLKFHYVPHYVIIRGETLNNPTMNFSLISWFFNSMFHSLTWVEKKIFKSSSIQQPKHIQLSKDFEIILQ
jgi:hypothetical protein